MHSEENRQNLKIFIHITWTQDKVKTTFLKKLPKNQILVFKKIKWIQLVFWKIESKRHYVTRRTDGRIDKVRQV